MNKLAIVTLAAVSAATFGVAGAFAQAGGDFAAIDTNHDQKVTLEEAMGPYPTLTQSLFDQADANKDGSLDEAEYGTLGGLLGGQNGGDSSSAAPSSEATSSSAM